MINSEGGTAVLHLILDHKQGLARAELSDGPGPLNQGLAYPEYTRLARGSPGVPKLPSLAETFSRGCVMMGTPAHLLKQQQHSKNAEAAVCMAGSRAAGSQSWGSVASVSHSEG